MSVNRSFNVLFLCTGNSARSVIGEALINRYGEGRFKGYSAGSLPKGEVNPYTIRLLKSLQYDTAQFRSKSWDEFAQPGAPLLDFIFTVCDSAASEVCPVWPGHPMSAHWGVPDPAAVEGNEAEILEAFAETYRLLKSRVEAFCALPFEALDKLSLQKRLTKIGKGEA